MQYLLTESELDELKNKPRVTAQEFLNKLGEFIVMEKACLDVTMEPIWVIHHKNFLVAVTKTVEYFSK